MITLKTMAIVTLLSGAGVLALALGHDEESNKEHRAILITAGIFHVISIFAILFV